MSDLSETPEDTFCCVMAHVINTGLLYQYIILSVTNVSSMRNKAVDIEPPHDKTNKMTVRLKVFGSQ